MPSAPAVVTCQQPLGSHSTLHAPNQPPQSSPSSTTAAAAGSKIPQTQPSRFLSPPARPHETIQPRPTPHRFPYPSLVASLGMVGSWIAATALCSLPGLVPPKSAPSAANNGASSAAGKAAADGSKPAATAAAGGGGAGATGRSSDARFFFTYALPTGFIMASAIYLGNLSYLYLSGAGLSDHIHMLLL